MMRTFSIADVSPAAAGTVVGKSVVGLGDYPLIRLDAELVGATNGTLDVYLQRLVKPGVWTDWLHFAQLAAGAAAVRYSLLGGHGLSTTITASNRGSDAAPAVALAAATFLGGHPGDVVRAVYVAGAGTTAGAQVSLDFSGWGAYR
jgi:hypothetical protein